MEATGKIVDSLEVKLAHELKEYTKHHIILSQELEIKMQPHYELRAKLLSEKTNIEVKTEERKREITKLEGTIKEYEDQMENVVQVSIKKHTEQVGVIDE